MYKKKFIFRLFFILLFSILLFYSNVFASDEKSYTISPRTGFKIENETLVVSISDYDQMLSAELYKLESNYYVKQEIDLNKSDSKKWYFKINNITDGSKYQLISKDTANNYCLSQFEIITKTDKFGNKVFSLNNSPRVYIDSDKINKRTDNKGIVAKKIDLIIQDNNGIASVKIDKENYDLGNQLSKTDVKIPLRLDSGENYHKFELEITDKSGMLKREYLMLSRKSDTPVVKVQTNSIFTSLSVNSNKTNLTIQDVNGINIDKVNIFQRTSKSDNWKSAKIESKKQTSKTRLDYTLSGTEYLRIEAIDEAGKSHISTYNPAESDMNPRIKILGSSDGKSTRRSDRKGFIASDKKLKIQVTDWGGMSLSNNGKASIKIVKNGTTIKLTDEDVNYSNNKTVVTYTFKLDGDQDQFDIIATDKNGNFQRESILVTTSNNTALEYMTISPKITIYNKNTKNAYASVTTKYSNLNLVNVRNSDNKIIKTYKNINSKNLKIYLKDLGVTNETISITAHDEKSNAAYKKIKVNVNESNTISVIDSPKITKLSGSIHSDKKYYNSDVKLRLREYYGEIKTVKVNGTTIKGKNSSLGVISYKNTQNKIIDITLDRSTSTKKYNVEVINTDGMVFRENVKILKEKTETKREKLIRIAKTKLGAPYTQATNLRTGPNTFDCSGFVYYLHKQIGITVPTHTAAYTSSWDKYIVSWNNIQPGDTVFYYPQSYVQEGVQGHVAIYLGNDQVIESTSDPGTGKVVIRGNARARFQKVYRFIQD